MLSRTSRWTLSLAGLLCIAVPAAHAGGPGAGYTKGLAKTYGHRVQVGVQVGAPAPGPVIHARYGRAPRYAPVQVWIPGHYELVRQRVYVPGAVRQVWIPPVYVTRLDPCGRPVQVEVSPGRWQAVQDPGHHELRTVQVWRPGHYERR